MELTITLENPQKLGALFGPADRHLKMIRQTLGVQIFARAGQIKLTGSAGNVSKAAAVLQELQRKLRHSDVITADIVTQALSAAAVRAKQESADIVTLEVRKAWRDLTEAAKRHRVQLDSLILAQKRFDNTFLLLQYGRLPGELDVFSR